MPMERGVRDSRPAHDDKRSCIISFLFDFFRTSKMMRKRANSSQLPISELHGAIIARCDNLAESVISGSYKTIGVKWRFPAGKRLYHAWTAAHTDSDFEFVDSFSYLFNN
ncbi:hypothetical protein [Paucidesulfovibrio longus]|uniref:hypothetical protein n=1 Tax=Paucidesulfovibrio longus TaxID=889 RepID=UPI0012DCDA66|nr:hypothetical protein [Paucidesulfovibrio longus]